MRIDPESYERKLRKIRRQVGRRVLVWRGDYDGHKGRFHTGTIIEIPPTGTQVYPRLGYEADCGTKAYWSLVPWGWTELARDESRICRRCMKVKRAR